MSDNFGGGEYTSPPGQTNSPTEIVISTAPGSPSKNICLITGAFPDGSSGGIIKLNPAINTSNFAANHGYVSIFEEGGLSGSNIQIKPLVLTSTSVYSTQIITPTGENIFIKVGDRNYSQPLADSGSIEIQASNSFFAGTPGGNINIYAGDVNDNSSNPGNINLTAGIKPNGDLGVIKLEALVVEAPRAISDPSTSIGGSVYYNSVTGKLRVYNDVLLTWENLN